MAFFDTTPVGRLINRFSKDQTTVDTSVPQALSTSLAIVLGAIGSIGVISYVTPFFLVPALPLTALYLYVQRYYLRSSRELQRLDSVSKSPVLAHFSETLSGVQTIRAYNQNKPYVHESEKRLDVNMRAFYCNTAANRWLSVRLEAIGATVTFTSAVFAVLQRGSLDAGLAALSVTYAMNITSSLAWLVRTTTELENSMVSVERVLEYTELAVEAPPIIPDMRPRADWPSAGEIELQDYSLRYREGLDLVLRGISLRIMPREKVGIVGRTGAGKSSFVLALFRLVEAAGGRILIDGVDISQIGLDDLRSRLAIIPQDPVLFAGTLRSNVDPFGQYSDADMWDAFRSVHLQAFVQSQALQLEMPVAEGGENLSVGQRQLVCLARALLRKTKILVMDEATAAVDFETDALIQQTIRTEFKDRTVLTIAHRINTIIDYDKVLVLDKGRLVEFDRPSTLLANPDSAFAGLARSSQH
jgi:ATP-binding cassette subfamily C (CFTR/MRP) protein 1